MDGDWSVQDKKKLLELLKTFGVANYSIIHQHMPEKSEQEIKCFCEKFMEKAMVKWDRSKTNNVALKKWLNIMKKVNVTQMGCLTDVLPRALKYIALFEKRKDNACLNLNDCYKTLSDITAGLPSRKLNDTSIYFFHECLVNLAKSVTEGGNGSSYNYLRFLTNLKTFLKHQGRMNKQTKMMVFSNVLNPLSVPYNILQMTAIERDIILFQ